MNAQTIETIESIDTRIVDLPLKKVHNHSNSSHSHQSLLFLTLRTSSGVVAYGEGGTPAGTPFWGGESIETMKQVVDRYLAPALIGENLFGHETLLLLMDRVASANFFAKAAVDVVLHDAVGRILGLPVSAFYGGRVRESMPVLWVLVSGNAGVDIEDAENQLENRRHRTFKIKMGLSDPRSETERVVQTVKAIHAMETRAIVTVDLNQAWDFPTCMQYLPRLQDAGVAMVEQPLPKWQLEGLSNLSARLNIPIAADESLWDFRDAFTCFKAGVTGLYGVKVGKGGGIRRAYKAAAIAEAAGIPIYGGMALESSIGTAAALQLFSALPTLAWDCELVGPLLLADDLATTATQYREYEIVVPQGVGLGVEPDLDKIIFYSREK
ncbi:MULTISPECIES: muconate/chloromuconate family cycloisomerase [Comamonadaceae]|nr:MULTISPECIES: muconate/chloromuconate family cycloisomerase [Comamonadaceae]AEO20083.1 chloromuconate cycloisomerase [Variovorax sp. SRS16]VTU42845.1 Muconate cycloisomerase 1 [Variovorax sp. SRS16]VTU42883.1 Muconate cycloisomerase 1 [Variovorax sp. PBL-E5]VTU43714.1 Muconate cycloisomerase 1 [Variovorax sp. PBL-H6]